MGTNDGLNIGFRLLLAILGGASIGWERELHHKPAGLRTHMLVSLAAAVYVLIPLEFEHRLEPDSNALSRVIQGVATGIGFLGAGEILRDTSVNSRRIEIRGLTSAAAIWMSAALGVAAACGLWQLILLAAGLSFVILNLFKRLED